MKPIPRFASRLRFSNLSFLLLLTLAGCGTSPPADSGSGGGVGQDYEAIQAQARQRDQEVAEAFRLDHAADLPASAEEVLNRHLVAVGGRDAFDTIRTMVQHFSAHSTAGSMGELVRYYKKPFLYRQKASASPRAAVTDGDRFWMVGSEGWEEGTGENDYLPFLSMDNHVIVPETLGIVHELVGVAAMDGDPGFQVRRIWPNGKEDLLYFSALSGLLTAVRSEYPLMPDSWFSFWDYRDLGGVRIPYVHIRSIGEFGPPHGLVLQSVEINVPLPDSLFIPPSER